MSRKTEPAFVGPAKALAETGATLPVPLTRAVAGNLVPLRVGARREWQEWAVAHGYSEAQKDALNKVLQLLVRSVAYSRAAMKPGAQRCAADGQLVEPVNEEHRQQFALRYQKRPKDKQQASSQKLPEKQSEKKPEPRPAPPEPESAKPRKPTRPTPVVVVKRRKISVMR